jgi:hypothetical protein
MVVQVRSDAEALAGMEPEVKRRLEQLINEAGESWLWILNLICASLQIMSMLRVLSPEPLSLGSSLGPDPVLRGSILIFERNWAPTLNPDLWTCLTKAAPYLAVQSGARTSSRVRATPGLPAWRA